LNQLGFPQGDPGQPFRKIALVNGSLGGTGINSPGQKGFTFDIRRYHNIDLWLFKIRYKTYTVSSARMYLTPSFGNSNTIFDAWFLGQSSRSKTATTPSSTSGYDVAPGGYFNTQGVLQKEGDGTIVSKLGINGGGIRFQANFYSVLPLHSFINTKSALAFTGSNQNLSENISTRNLVCTNETPFDSYFGSFYSNREHVELWQDAINWVTEEIGDNPQFPPANYSNVYPISGLDQFCTTATYSIPNLPSGATVTWTVNPLGSVSLSPSGNSVILSISSYNYTALTLTASISTSSCGTMPVNKQVIVGNPFYPYGELMVYGETNAQLSGLYNYNIPPYPGAISYHWEVFGGTGNPATIFQNGGNSANIMFNSVGYYGVLVEVTTPCGSIWLDPQQLDVYVSNNYLYKYYPNPANNELIIEYIPQDTTSSSTEYSTAKASLTNLPPRVIKLLNEKGETLRSSIPQSEESKTVLDIRAIPSGTYFLHITEGKETIKKQIIIQH